MFRKNYARRVETLKIFRAYLQSLTQVTDPKEISHHTYQHILKAFLTLSEYGQQTQVYRTITDISKTKFPEGFLFDTLMEELKDIDFARMTKDKVRKNKKDNNEVVKEVMIPQIGTIFFDGKNADLYKTIIKNIDSALDFYQTLWEACNKE